MDLIQASPVKTSSDLQKLLDKYEGVTCKFYFDKSQKIEVKEPITMYSEMELIGHEKEEDKPVFHLTDNADKNLFTKQVPILRLVNAKNNRLYGISFFGNDTKQDLPPGQGFHNFFGPLNVKNLVMDNVTVKYSLGDGVRANTLTDCNFTRIKVIECGHDGLYLERGTNLLVENSYFEIRTNSATRFRAVKNGTFQNNWVENKVVNGNSTGPGFQAENSMKNTYADNYIIKNNYFKNIWGPGIWAVGTINPDKNAATGLLITGNTFENCGSTQKNTSRIVATGGICCDGWSGAIEKNLFVNCKGNSVNVGPYVEAGTNGEGYELHIQDNIFFGTSKGVKEFSEAGMALAKTTTHKTTVLSENNVYWNNEKDAYFNVPDAEKFDPVLEMKDGLYTLGVNSPCRSRDIGARDIWNVKDYLITFVGPGLRTEALSKRLSELGYSCEVYSKL